MSGIRLRKSRRLRTPQIVYGGVFVLFAGVFNPGGLLIPTIWDKVTSTSTQDMIYVLPLYTGPCLLMSVMALVMLGRGRSIAAALGLAFLMTCAVTVLLAGLTFAVIDVFSQPTLWRLLRLPLDAIKAAVLVTPFAAIFAVVIGLPALVFAELVLFGVTRRLP